MKKHIVVLVLLFNVVLLYAQLDETTVMGIPTGSTSEINAVTPLEQGALAFDTDTKKLKLYNGTAWVDTSTATTIVSENDDNQIETGTDGGAYLGPTVYTGYFIIEGPGGNSTATSTFTKTIEDIPFKPSQVTFIAHANIESETINDDNGEDSPSGGNNNTGISNAFGTMNGFVRYNVDDDNYTQQVIYIGGSGNSINDISRYASPDHCVGLRYSNQNGNSFGIINGSFDQFNDDGFNLIINYVVGSESNTGNERADFKNEDVLVMFTAYK